MWIERLYPEQRPAFEFVCSRPGSLILGDTAVGKTIITLAALEHLQPHLTLIVAPLTSLDITWAPKLVTLPGSLCRDWDGFGHWRKHNPVTLLIHFQLFAKLAEKLERVPWDMVIIDESQGIKDRNSAQSRAARRMRHAKRRLALSATPLDKTPIDIWAQMRFVDHTVFGESFTPFKNDFCYEGGYKNHEVKFHISRLPAFLSRLTPCIFRLEKSFLQLKPLRIIPIPVPLLGAQGTIYRQMYEHGIVNVDGVTIPAPLPVTRQAKLEQITGGTIKDEDDQSHVVGMAKIRKLRTLTAGLTPPLVIFCKYLAEIPLIQGALPQGRRVETLTGAVVDSPRDKRRTNLIIDFQAGRVDYLICQVRTGGVSIELTAASTMIFYSMNFSLIDFTQIIGRLHRGSQLHPVSIYVLYAQDTVDEKIIREIAEKQETFSAVVEAFTQPGSACA
jgi:SNF2 family DNA or RNA helicase